MFAVRFISGRTAKPFFAVRFLETSTFAVRLLKTHGKDGLFAVRFTLAHGRVFLKNVFSYLLLIFPPLIHYFVLYTSIM
jgi:hypothetical protein